MDLGKFNLFIKMITEEYKLSSLQLEMIRYRLLADDMEFEKVWKLYSNKNAKFRGGVDHFKTILHELIS